MKFVSRVATATLMFVLPALVLAATNLTGTWQGKMDAGGDAVFHIKADDKTIGGTMLGADGKEHPISDAKLDGDNISFNVASEWQGMPVKLIVTGKVSGDQMQLHIAADNGYWATDATVKRASK